MLFQLLDKKSRVIETLEVEAVFFDAADYGDSTGLYVTLLFSSRSEREAAAKLTGWEPPYSGNLSSGSPWVSSANVVGARFSEHCLTFEFAGAREENYPETKKGAFVSWCVTQD